MDDFKQRTLNLHKKNTGKLDLIPNISLETREDMSMAYTPGVAIPCLEIVKDKSKAYDYTIKGKTVAIITDGTAVLGLGDIGPEAALPVMEGKSALLYKFSGIQAVPICLDTKDPDEIIKTVKYLAPTFSGIMLEDIKSPECVYIEDRLQEELNIPVFHDDQHGTAIVVGAALKNALRYLKRDIESQKIVVCGTGAAGNAIIRTLDKMGAKHIYGINTRGVLSKDNLGIFNIVEKSIINDGIIVSPKTRINSLEELMVGKDIFIGVSARNILTEAMVKSMNKDSVIFAMANPDPEIMPDLAKNAGASIVGTGRSDFPNQINNVLIFPGLMKGIIESRAKTVNFDIKLKALNAIASLVTDEELSEVFILPSIFDKRVAETVCEAVKSAKK
jgi:malate dehydrogenase (oxaloacetate-decarboxylating)